MPGDVSISGLLDAAQRLLSEQIAPHLDTEKRYLALMIGSAMRMAAREAEQRDRLAEAEAALLGLVEYFPAVTGEPPAGPAGDLSRAFRGGLFDADPRAHGLLWNDAVVRTSVTKPSALARAERGMAGLPGEKLGP